MLLCIEDKQLIEAAKEAIDRNYDSINWWHTVGRQSQQKTEKFLWALIVIV